MAFEQTFSMIKPDAVARNVIGEIYSRFEKAGQCFVAAHMLQLSKEQAEEFYAVPDERPFYGERLDYMTSGPVMAQVLEDENAVHMLAVAETARAGTTFFFGADGVCPRPH